MQALNVEQELIVSTVRKFVMKEVIPVASEMEHRNEYPHELVRQMQEMKSGARKGARATSMIPIAKALGEGDFKAAAEYFGSLKAPVWYKVVETDTVPKSYLGNGAMRFPVAHA